MKENKLKYKLNLQNFADPDPAMGSDNFPATPNAYLDLVETIANQNVKSVKSTNQIEDAFFEYKIDDGKVIEEALVEMAEAYTFVPVEEGHQPDFSPKDPKVWVKYFDNYEGKQLKTTTRLDEIRSIVANKGTSAEQFASEIVDTLTKGENNFDYKAMRAMIENTEYGVNASTDLFSGNVPLNSKGIMYAIRQMFYAVTATNTCGIMTEGNDKIGPEQGVEVANIRIAISESVLSLIDFTELGSLYHLSKEEILGKVIVLPFEPNKGNLVRVYDVKSFGRATRLYEYENEIMKGNRYINHWLTTDRAYFFNGLFKNYYLDVSHAVATEVATMIGSAS